MTRRLHAVFVFVAMAAMGGQTHRSGALDVTAVRYWSLADTTRIAIEVSGDATLKADRIDNPDRIFFDFVGARPYIDGRRVYTSEVADKLVKRIRVAETSPDVTRVVLDLESAADYTVSRLTHPNRFVIEIRPRGVPAANRAAEAGEHPVEPVRREPEAVPHEIDPPKRVEAAQPVAMADPPVVKPSVPRAQLARINAKPAILPPPVIINDPPPPSTKAPAPAAPKPPVSVKLPAVSNAAQEESPAVPTPHATPKAARATSSGERSLTRALGLKVRRVVIDPGHGGADQGTVGRRGLMEKELVLDVSKRLGRLIEDRMESEVIYTRSDDTFIQLEARTELANQKKADLFLSIHANSSPHPKIGGIEVYYLNFTRSADALDVATRENASAEKSVFELREIIQSITMHDKIEESREFAGKVQGSLQAFEARYNSAAKNRGVKKAPFVVLIGASMPSVLAEVGFLSNAREEMLLKRPEHRQKLAESLYQGLFRYAQSLSHFQVAQRAE